MVKNIEQDQNFLNAFKKEFEIADGLGISKTKCYQNNIPELNLIKI